MRIKKTWKCETAAAAQRSDGGRESVVKWHQLVLLVNNSSRGLREAGRMERERERKSEVVAFKGVLFNNSAGGVWPGPMQQVAAVKPKKITGRIKSSLKPFPVLRLWRWDKTRRGCLDPCGGTGTSQRWRSAGPSRTRTGPNQANRCLT